MFQNPHYSCSELSRLLLSKGIPFCLYRFPNDSQFHLAIDKAVLPSVSRERNGEDTDFIIAPFIKNADSQTVLFKKLSGISEIGHLAEFIENLEPKPIIWGTLPESISKDVYMNRIHHYLDEIKSGILSKAILSRVIQIEKPQQFDVTHFYTLLASAYPETFVSLFYIPGMGIWTGATPELLLEKENKTYRTMALASTQPKKAIGDYSWRNKEKEEHRLVQQHIEEVFLKNDCQLTDSKGPYTIESGQVAHLKTDYTFEEKNPDNQNNITDQLHPTPAIGGLPVDASLECIKKYEGYNRNYYSGYLGETNHRDLARLFINLRCMQIGKDKIAIFAGGGISIDSDPEEEWAETNQKSLTLLEIIEETTRHHA